MLKRFFKSKIGVFYTSQYGRTLILYSIFTILALLISAVTIIGNYNKSLVSECEKSNKRLLTQVQESSDIMLQESIMSLIYGKFVDITLDKNFNSFFSENDLYNVDIISRIQLFFSGITTDKKYIDSIYLYRKSDDTIITSKEGLVLSSSSPENYNRQFINMDSIEKIMNSDMQSFWISPYENAHRKEVYDIKGTETYKNSIYYWTNKPIISFAQTIPVISKSNKLGCIVVNIDESSFFKTINHVDDPKLGELMIVDSNGRVFSRSKQELLLGKEQVEGYIKGTLTGDEGFKTTVIEGRQMGVSWIKSTLYDWWYVSVVPVETLNRQPLLAKQLSMLMLLFFVLLSLVSVNLITVKLYKPFRMLFKSISNKFNVAGESRNEIAMVNDIINKLSDSVEEMEKTLATNQSSIRHKIVSDIIYGTRLYSLDDIKDRLKIAGESLSYKYFCLLVIEVDGRGLEKLTSEQREFISYKIIDIVDGHFREKSTSISISLGRNRIAALLNFSNYGLVESSLNYLICLFKSELGVSSNIAASHSTEDITRLAEEYEYSCSLLQYSFIYDYGNIFNPDMVEALEKSTCYFDMSLFDSLVPLLKACKIEPLKDQIEIIFAALKEGAFSYSYIQNILLQLIGIFSKVIKEQKLHGEIIDDKKILARFYKIYSIDECREWMMGLIDVYAEGVGVRNGQVDDEFILKVKNYICSNIEADIKLNGVAARFGMSPNYLSRIFKENTGICFSDYVLEKKLEKAKEILLSEKDVKISAIADRIGYFHTPYFIGKFKEKYGMTPARLRKSKI